MIVAEQLDIIPNANLIDINMTYGKVYNYTVSILFTVVALISIGVWVEMTISDKRQVRKELREAEIYKTNLENQKKKE